MPTQSCGETFNTSTNNDSVITARRKRGDEDLMKEVAEKLVNIMPELATEFWEDAKKKKKEAASDARLER